VNLVVVASRQMDISPFQLETVEINVAEWIEHLTDHVVGCESVIVVD